MRRHFLLAFWGVMRLGLCMKLEEGPFDMSATSPPPLPSRANPRLSGMSQVIIGSSVLVAICFGTLVVLRVFGLIRPFSVPTGAMAPAVTPGDHVMMEAFT